jgi:hypothetical protein
MKSCPLCKAKFKPWKGQKIAYWSINWCTTDKGFLCPECYKAAEELNALYDPKDKEPYCPQVPWGSDITKLSKSTTDEQKKKQRSSENLTNW